MKENVAQAYQSMKHVKKLLLVAPCAKESKLGKEEEKEEEVEEVVLFRGRRRRRRRRWRRRSSPEGGE